MDSVNNLPGQISAQKAAENVVNNDQAMITLREQIAQSQTKLDGFAQQQQELDAKELQYKNIATLATKKKKTNTALLIASLAGGIAATVAVGFLCLPLITLPIVGTTFGLCTLYKKREQLDGAIFHTTHSMVDLQKQLAEMGKQLELDNMRKLKKRELAMLKGVDDVARMAENLAEQEAAEVLDQESFIVINGTKLAKNPVRE